MLRDGTNNLTYDVENRPVVVNGSAATYDATGGRVILGTTTFVGDIYEIDGLATTRYYFFNGTRIASRKIGGPTYYHGDQLNSATTLTNSNGGVVSRQVLSPFGRRLAATGSDPIGLAGNRLDPLTGLYHMGAREMNPSSGLFITPDPSGAPDAEKPQTLNRYAYANNSPTNLVDLTGFQAMEPVSGEEYKKNLYSFWKNARFDSKGVTSNEQVERIGKQANEQPTKPQNLVASDARRTFIKDIAKPTFKVQERINDPANPNEFILVLSGGQQVQGDIKVTDATRASQGGGLDIDPSKSFMVHWHYKGIEQQPSVGDDSPAKAGVPSFVVTTDKDRSSSCCKVWEVGVQNSKPVYRDVTSDKLGPWTSRSDWK